MAATTVSTDLYTKKTKVLELTVKDKAAVIVDLSSIVSPSEDIHWIMQKGPDDITDHIYKSLGNGIAYKTDGADGIILITIPLGVDLPDLDASAGDLSYFHQLSVELLGQPAVTAEGTLTIKHGQGKVVSIEITFPSAADSASECTPGTLQTDNNLDAPAAADSASSCDAGVLTTTIGV